MAVDVTQYKIDDLIHTKDPRKEVLADETIRFAIGKNEYEIDLTTENAGKFLRKFQPYMDAGRRLHGPGQGQQPRTAAHRRRSGEIRAWAKDNGIAVSERGRIPTEIVAKYQAAHV